MFYSLPLCYGTMSWWLECVEVVHTFEQIRLEPAYPSHAPRHRWKSMPSLLNCCGHQNSQRANSVADKSSINSCRWCPHALHRPSDLNCSQVKRSMKSLQLQNWGKEWERMASIPSSCITWDHWHGHRQCSFHQHTEDGWHPLCAKRSQCHFIPKFWSIKWIVLHL